ELAADRRVELGDVDLEEQAEPERADRTVGGDEGLAALVLAGRDALPAVEPELDRQRHAGRHVVAHRRYRDGRKAGIAAGCQRADPRVRGDADMADIVIGGGERDQ